MTSTNTKNFISNKYLSFMAMLIAISIILGALGAHWLKNILTADELISFQTASRYLFIQSIALFFMPLLQDRLAFSIILPIWFMTIGIILFSGSIYILLWAKHNIDNMLFLGPITPIGGLLLIIGWIWLGIIFFIKKK